MLILHELAPSPNNLKVRMALRYKSIPFEARPVNPANREPLIEISGQEATPVIEDRGVVINDSEAILQYLDANYPRTRRLYPRLKDGRRQCDRWKQTVEREVAAAWLPIFFFTLGVRDRLDDNAVGRYQESLQWLDGQLEEAPKEDDDAMHGLRAALWSCYALPSEGLMNRVPFFRKMKERVGQEAGTLPRVEACLDTWAPYFE